MNYIQEINSFRKFTEINPLQGATQSLWFLLMHINNKCNWIEWFSSSNDYLASELCMTKKTVIKHREILVESGLILYQSQKKKKTSGLYKLISLEQQFRVDSNQNRDNMSVKITPISEKEDNMSVKITPISENEDNMSVKITPISENEDNMSVKITPISEKEDNMSVKITPISENEDNMSVKITPITKLIHSISTTTINSDFENQNLKTIEKFFNDNFYLMGSYESNQFKKWLKEFNSDVIILALEEAVKKGVKNYKYIEGILKNWLPLNLKTVEEIKTHMESFSSKQNVSKNEKVSPITKNNKFHNFDQREKKYTNEELEKKLGIRK